MNKKFVAAIAAFAALCGMVSAPANAVEPVQSIREDVTPHVLVAIPVPDSEPVSEPEPVDVDALAAAVIRGEYGVGDERRAALGDNYDAVQARVNELVPIAAPVVAPVQAAPVQRVAPVVAPVEPAPQAAPVESAPVQSAPQSYTFDQLYNLATDLPYCQSADGAGSGSCYYHSGSGEVNDSNTDIVYVDGYGYRADEATGTVTAFPRQ